MKFTFTPTAIPELVLIEHEAFGDSRGSFSETYKRRDFADAGVPFEFVQDNHSRSDRGVLRGLHFQNEPAAIGKLVRCVRGRIFDVAVDVRRGSPTFRKWVSVELSDENRRMLWVPAGFAHGFLTLSDVADVLYKVTGYYSPEHDRGIAWNDPDIGVQWPISSPALSDKDSVAPRLKDSDCNLVCSSPSPGPSPSSGPPSPRFAGRGKKAT